VKLLEHWLPPDGAGDPVACLATTFTFEADFFTSDCLARFLRLSGAYQEGDRTADVALLLEEEERLSEATVVVVADRSCRPEARNLRWDLLAATVPGALLHAKVTALVWQRAMRFIVSSANLTSAGYRRQLETGVAFDVEPGAAISRPLLEALVAELRDIVTSHTHGDVARPGPKRRALEILDIAAQRVSDARLPATGGRGVRVALAAGRTRSNPLDALASVWRGGPPRRAVALSPFWDGGPDLAGAQAVLDQLAKRSAHGKRPVAMFVVAVEPSPGGVVVRAPPDLARVAPSRIDADVRAVAKEADDLRRLHAKVVLFEGDDCIAAMVGSSNVTAKGLGLDPNSHREVNVWFACAPGTKEAAQLAALAPYADPVDPSFAWQPSDDEDQLSVEPLPEGFVDALLVGTDAAGPRLQLTLDGRRLPTVWSLTTPAGTPVLDDRAWSAEGRPTSSTISVTDTALPSALDVRWQAGGADISATWPVNVVDTRLLPPPAELRDLPVGVLLGVLASTRPLRQAFEDELRRQARAGPEERDELDPLKRFDSSGLLLQRVRRASIAFWGLQQRLARPLATLQALEWRLGGSIGPESLARALCDDVVRGQLSRSEARFLLAELALTVSAVDWSSAAGGLNRQAVRQRVAKALSAIGNLVHDLGQPDVDVDGLTEYIEHALTQAGAS
jgi:hypothetical protein